MRNEVQRLFIFVALLIVIGTAFYHWVEQWSWIDSYYFSVMTLTTVGYGDVVPQTEWGKIFTTLYVLGGLGIVFAFLQALASRQTMSNLPRKFFETQSSHHRKK